MRLISLALFTALMFTTLMPVPPALAHDTAADPALHCAALITLSGQILADDGQASESDLAQVREIANIMLLHSTMPTNQRSVALRAYAAQYRKTHSVEEISQDVQREGDGCIANFVN